MCVSNEIEDLNLHVFNMITGINESITLTKHISWKFDCKFDSKKCNWNQKWNNDKCQCECKNLKEHRVCKKCYFWNSARCSFENGKYAEIIIGDTVGISDEIINTTKLLQHKLFQQNAL